MNHLIVGNTTSRRVKYWQAALEQKGLSYQIISFKQVVNGEWPVIKGKVAIRITSPGEDFETYKLLLDLGEYPQVKNLIYEKGLVQESQYWYKGWCILLDKIERFMRENMFRIAMNYPKEIALVFHKLKCQQFLAKNSISIPEIISEKVNNYDELLKIMDTQSINQVFIKPYHGSSASGVMAFRKTNNKQILHTTIQLKKIGQEIKLYNHLKLQQYNNVDDIKTIINEMAKKGLMSEKWIRKQTFKNKSVDFRVLVINGKAIFVVPRMSQHFITNLHLGNEKGVIEAVESVWGKAIIDSARQIAEKAVESLQWLFYAGVDVAIDTQGKPYVLEINAFGDLLLNIERDSLNTYEYELKAWNEKFFTKEWNDKLPTKN